jgi:hypothetical protein
MTTSVRRAVPAAVLTVALTACGPVPSRGTPSDTTTPITTAPTRTATTTAVARTRTTTVRVQPAAFPAGLVGVWDGGSGVGRITFADDGRFEAARYRGTATVRGTTMVMRLEGGQSLTTAWSLDGGILRLGTSTYLRDDTRTGGAIALVGTWININGYTTIEFGSDGSFELDDQANDVVIRGTYVLRGNRLTFSSSSKAPTTYVLSLDTFLTFSNTGGTVVGEYTRAG